MVGRRLLSAALVSAITATSALLPAHAAADEQGFEKEVRPFLDRHCVACHGPDKTEAELRLDRLRADAEPETLASLAKVFRVLNAGEMPPDGRTAPDKADTARVLGWIKAHLATARREAGSGGLRRLNRREIANTLNDLFGLNADFAALLPPDGLKDDFDNRAETLHVTDSLVESYLELTRRVVDNLHVGGPRPAPREHVFDFVALSGDPKAAEKRPEFRGYRIKKYLRPEGLLLPAIAPKAGGDLDNAIRGGTFANSKILLSDVSPGGLLRVHVVFHTDGEEHDRTPRFHVYVNTRERAACEVTGTPDRPQELFFDVYAEELRATGSGSADLGLGFENVHPKAGFGQTVHEVKGAPPVFVRSVRVVDGFRPNVVPEGTVGDSDSARVERVLHDFLSRAFRRPVSDLEPWTARYDTFRSAGASETEALRACLQVALASPGFLYLPSPEGLEGGEHHYAIASRLSYFLWSTGPDERLLSLAADRRLLDPDVLRAEVDRVLGDSRAARFHENFVLRWTGLRNLDIPFESGDDWFRAKRYVEEAIQGEAVAFFREAVESNAPAIQLLRSEFVMRNDVLAAYYGSKVRFGHDFERVALSNDDPRGGLLGQAGIMAMTGNGKPPITRGVWMLRKILDDPPPDPPLDVPELNASDPSLRKRPLREQLRVHQEQPDCAVCHAKIDPLGFAFEHFDTTGRWMESRKVGKKGSEPIDSSGRLPRGESFADFEEMRSVVVGRYQDDFARGLTKNLLAYAVGRDLLPEDLETVDDLLEQSADEGHRLKDLLEAIVTSDAFLER